MAVAPLCISWLFVCIK